MTHPDVLGIHRFDTGYSRAMGSPYLNSEFHFAQWRNADAQARIVEDEYEELFPGLREQARQAYQPYLDESGERPSALGSEATWLSAADKMLYLSAMGCQGYNFYLWGHQSGWNYHLFLTNPDNGLLREGTARIDRIREDFSLKS